MHATAPVVIILGPALSAISGVSTHLKLLLGSSLTQDFSFNHFQVGSEGRRESLPGRLLRLLFSPLALMLRIFRTGASVVHINTSLNPRAYWRDLAYLLVAKMCATRVVYQVHGGALPRDFAAGHPLRLRLLQTVLTLPDAIVVLARSELAAYREFVPGQIVVAIPNAIALPSLLRPEQAPSPDGVLRLVYVGRLARDKGLGEALRGLALARAADTAATLTIAGSGPDAESLAAEARELGIKQAVLFVGPVFADEKQRLLAEADVLLLPTYAEGMPYALLEAMAAGLPAITTRVGGIPDVVVEAVHGLFVPVRDDYAIAGAITRLANDRELLLRAGHACRRRIAHSYSSERLADDFSHLYAALCASRRVGLLGRS
jgi:glycosyltransferase involved in cell wall biosynthesis